MSAPAAPRSHANGSSLSQKNGYGHRLVTFSSPAHTHEVMGKLIQFPIDRLRSRRLATAGVFSAFGELETLERHQLKMMLGYAGVALLCMFALQLVLG
jgi:hypothetical protein